MLKTTAAYNVQLGLGLISIGRSWGYRKHPVPSSDEVCLFLDEAVKAGLRFFDTAPSYGRSEERVGLFLSGIDRSRAEQLRIATKAGEHWCPDTGELTVDHSYEALMRSVERSLRRLGRIDVLQVHKATAAIVTSGEVRRALEDARACGVSELGASVTDVETAAIVLKDNLFQTIQFPFHLKNRQMEQAFTAAAHQGKPVLVNRPFGMGEILYQDAAGRTAHEIRVDAFRAILTKMSDGIVLTGTRSVEHLQENIRAFVEAMNAVRRPSFLATQPS